MIDYEVEYNNRARVPEHPDIMAGWARDAAQFRSTPPGRAEFGIAYGPGERQRYDLFAPKAGDGPLALFIHGGYWQALGKSSFSHMAAGATAHGLIVAIAGYTLCPETTVKGIVEEMTSLVEVLARRFRRPMVIAGHSAGGHLAGMLLATPWGDIAPDLGFDPVPAALTLSGLFDLEPLVSTTVNEKLMLAPDIAKELSPILRPAPRGKRLVAVVGAEESSEYIRQSAAITERWGKGGVAARTVIEPGANHFTIIGPLADPDSDLTRGLVALSKT